MNLLESLRLGAESLWRHKLRSLLTMLGIIFGVGAVIAMLSIGAGAEHEALQAIEALGLHNVLIQAKLSSDEELRKIREKSLGLSWRDAEALKAVLPHVRYISPRKRVNTQLLSTDRGSVTDALTVLGVAPGYEIITNLGVVQGRFFSEHEQALGAPVCVLGSQAKQSIFGYGDAVRQRLKVNDVWLTVVGVLERKTVSLKEFQGVPLENINTEILLPIHTVLKRFTFQPLESEVDAVFLMTDGQISSAEIARVADRVLRQEHRGVADYSLIVPEILLEQSRRTQRLFAIVLGSIAGISLLVGGIGIMNIMLATVLERTSEIGVRRAVGARRSDILRQFILEAISIGAAGGLLGIALGLALAQGVVQLAHLKTIVTPSSVVLALSVAISTAIVFSLYPARQAARLDPVDALRHE